MNSHQRNIWFTGLLLFLPLAGLLAQTAQLTVKVIVSPKIPKTDSLVIMGNQPQWGNWFSFAYGIMHKLDDTTWVYTGRFPVNKPLDFQLTRGSYYKTAIFTNGRNQAPQMPFSIKHDTTITLRPATWNDIFNRSITGTVKYYHNFEDHNLKYTRDVMVWLPPSYYRSPNKRYPVLYAEDGQNVFSPSSIYSTEWHMDEISDSLMRCGKVHEYIIVAIDNTKDRLVEYSGAPEGIKYMSFIVHNLKPFIDAHFRTKPGRDNTAAIGSSMGGLISFYLVWKYPGVFSKAACLSSGFTYDDGHILQKFPLSSKKLPGTKLYLDCGDQGLDKYFLPDNEKMKAMLEKHPEINLMFRVFPGETHNEAAWSKRLWIPLTFLFGKDQTRQNLKNGHGL